MKKNSKQYKSTNIYLKITKSWKFNGFPTRLIYWGPPWTGMISNHLIGLPVRTTSYEILKRSQSGYQFPTEPWLAPLDCLGQIIIVVIYNSRVLMNNKEHVYIKIYDYIFILDDDTWVEQRSNRREFAHMMGLSGIGRASEIRELI